MKTALIVVSGIIASFVVLMFAVDLLVLSPATPLGKNATAMKACVPYSRSPVDAAAAKRIRACYTAHGGTGYLQITTLTKTVVTLR